VDWLRSRVTGLHALSVRPLSCQLSPLDRRFRDLDDRAIRRDACPKPNLSAALEAYRNANSDSPSGFVWSAPAERSLANAGMGSVALQRITAQSRHTSLARLPSGPW